MTELENDCQEAEDWKRVIDRCTTGWTFPVYESVRDAVDSKLMKTKIR